MLGARPVRHIEKGSYASWHVYSRLVRLCAVFNTSAAKPHSASAAEAEVVYHLLE